MLKSNKAKILIAGLGCVLLSLVAAWYSNTFNESRLVEKMDYSTYVFILKDIPMIVSILLLVAYFLFLAFLWVKLMIKKVHSKPTHTSTLNPKLGLHGFLGFLGFAGFGTYSANQGIHPFIFFGFYFEGKMSNTLMDERFRENRNKAQLKAFKIAFVLLFIIIFLVGRGLFADDLAFCSAFLVSSISIIFALTIFLGEYFLFCYDYGKKSVESVE